MYDNHGGPEVMQLRELPVPTPAADELLICVEATSVNPVDWKIMASAEVSGRFGVTLPGGIGNDLAGSVVEVGSEVADWAVGDRIMTSARGRALQEYTTVRPASVAIARLPEGLDAATAACMNVAGRTAWDAVATIVRPQETLLVHGGSGAVGQLAIQFARQTGARVVATGSAARAERIRSLGAEAIEYGGDLRAKLEHVAPISAVLDCADGEGIRVGLELGAELHRCISISVKNAHGASGVATDLEQTAPLQHLVDLLDGEVDVEIGARYTFADARLAYEAALQGKHPGKIVIDF